MIRKLGIVFISLFTLTLLFSYIINVNNFNTFAQNSTVSPSVPNATQTTGGIKIISPDKGDNVPINSNSSFIIKGISKDNPTSDCKVSVIINNVKPYQNAQPISTEGNGDYSTWQYTLSQNYTNITEGANKITSKFTCLNNPQS